MPNLIFTVMPAGVGLLYDLLSCLVKFDENISLEAYNDHVRNGLYHESLQTDPVVLHF